MASASSPFEAMYVEREFDVFAELTRRPSLTRFPELERTVITLNSDSSSGPEADDQTQPETA